VDKQLQLPIQELISRSVINVNKPSGPTSRDIIQEIKDIFKLKRCGHAGTLDPRVSGVLLVTLENATKAMPVLMGLDKEYDGVMYLHKDVDKKTLEKIILDHFIGEITQIPPVKSHVARKPRKRIVYSFEILKKDRKDVWFKTRVQAGTYIRKLCSDIGEKLGVGAQMKELWRTKVGHFSLKDSYILSEIKEAYERWESGDDSILRKIVIPIEKAIPHVKRVYVNDNSVSSIKNGAPVLSSDVIKVQEGIKLGETVGIFSSKEKLIALGISKTCGKMMLNKKRNVIRTDRVI
jgi:H/ACA ribonucleoprotein complex subunit 4